MIGGFIQLLVDLSYAIDAGNEALGVFVSDLGNIPQYFSELVQSVSQLPAAFLEGCGEAGKSVQDLANFVGSLLRELLATIGGFVSSIVQEFLGIVGGAQTAIGNLTSVLANIPSMAASAVGNLGSVLFSAGSDLIGGLLSGIQSRVQGVISYISGIAEQIKNKFKELFKIGSPSKVFADYGG